MSKNLAYLIIFVTILVSCKAKTQTHIIDFGIFTIEVPITWTKGLSDTNRGSFLIDSSEFIGFEMGDEINDLESYLKVRTIPSQGYTIYPPLSGSANLLENSKATFSFIDGKKAKIIIPLKTGTGVTGVYIDSIIGVKGEIIRLQISGENLLPESERKFIKAIKTIKFKNLVLNNTSNN